MKKNIFLSPSRTLLISILGTIILGTLLLLLPISQNKPISFIDCLFSSVSTTCVAGFLTVPLSLFSLFGQFVLLVLIQIGGIGLITLSLFLISLFTKLGFGTQLMIGKILEFESWKKVKPMLMFIIFFTLISELFGAILIFFTIHNRYSFHKAIFHSVFHSISSFCSAGLSSFGGDSLISFNTDFLFLLFTGILIILGTFGFITWHELFYYFKNKIASKRASLSLSSYIVLVFSTLFIIIFTVLLLVLENPVELAGKPYYVKLYNMVFNALSYRSTGFTTLELSTMRMATLFLILIYSFIGSAPGSTGSGIKITTFIIFLATIKSVILGKSFVEIKERRIMQEQLFSTMSVIAISFFWIIIITFLLLIIENDYLFSDIFFETVSSFTTLGLCTGITATFSIFGKLIIMVNIFVGRVGILILLLALRTHKEPEFNYPEERITIT